MTTASLVQSGQQNASLAQVVDTLDAYGLSRDDFMETMREMQVGHNDDAIKALPIGHEDRVLLDAYAAIESKTKAALTRLYNKRHKTKTKTKAKKTKEEAEEDDEDDEKSDAGI